MGNGGDAFRIGPDHDASRLARRRRGRGAPRRGRMKPDRNTAAMIRHAPLAAAICLGLLLSSNAAAQPDRERLPAATFPAEVRTIEGATLDVATLATTRRVVVVTLKATWCTVCQRQLARIHRALPNPDECGIAIVVLSPGPTEALREIKKRLGVAYSFVEDRDLSIADSFGLRLTRDQIQPSILILDRDRSVGWMQRGRSDAHFGDPELLKEIDCMGVI